MFREIVVVVAIASGLLLGWNFFGNPPEFLRVSQEALHLPTGWLALTAGISAIIARIIWGARVASGKDAEEMQRKWNKK